MKDDGGSAFPVSDEGARGKVASIHGGLSVRDYFAAKAMVGLISFENGERLNKILRPQELEGRNSPMQYFAQVAYELADAMLAERAKP